MRYKGKRTAKDKRKPRPKRRRPAKRKQRSTKMVKLPNVTVPLRPLARREHGLRPEQIALLQRTVAKDTTPDELALFLLVARKHKLDPFTRQLHCVKRKNSATGQKEMAIQIGIDGYRAMAARSHKDFGSIGEPEFEWGTDKKYPVLARIKLWKKGVEQPTVAVAYWAEFAPKDINAPEAFMWRRMPRHMLAKCAESLALRKAYPDLADIYTDEEMMQADDDLSPEGRELTGTDGRPLYAGELPDALDPEPPTTAALPTDPKEGVLAKITDYREIKWRKSTYAQMMYGKHQCSCWRKSLWPHLKAGVGELAVLIIRRSGSYLNIVGISSIGNQTFTEIEGEFVPDVQRGKGDDSAAKLGFSTMSATRVSPAVARPAHVPKIVITFRGDIAEITGDTAPLRERIEEMHGRRNEERRLYEMPATWVPSLAELCAEYDIEVEERDAKVAR